jgi:imidazolonepropionase-like amidohydrolase
VRLAQLGGRIGAGSDTPAGAYNLPGGGLHLEMELMTRAGLSPLQALSSATGTAADILQREDIGRIAVGRRVDLLVVEGDPSQDIRDTRRLRQVILDGQVLDPAALKNRALEDGEALLASLMAEQAD